jgi:hypothetical protein
VKKISFVVNLYIDTDENVENQFDHPTVLKTFNEENTFCNTVDSIKKAVVPEGYEVDLIVLANAVNNVTTFDQIIRDKVENVIRDSKISYNCILVTNSAIFNLRSNGIDFISTDGYCELRNLGFVFAFHNNSDIIVQIDDDELVKETHLVKMVEIFSKYPEIKILSGLYQNANGIYQDETKDYIEWGKDKAMNDDRRIITAADKPVEIMYGMGGNMMIKREYFSKICYPERVPRGEDFALLLASNLIYLNGNEIAEIESWNDYFKTYSVKEEDIIIIHKQPYSEKKNRLKYVKLNLIRFIKQKYMLNGYISKERFWEVSRYMYLMTMNDDFLGQVRRIYNEVIAKYPEDCTKQEAEKDYFEVCQAYEKYSNRDLFAEYKEYQKKYLDCIKARFSVKEYRI